MVSALVLRLPVLFCLAALLSLQVPWAFCLHEDAVDGIQTGGAPLVVSVHEACEHVHPHKHGAGAHSHEPVEHEQDHGHEHVLLTSVGTSMPPAVSLDGPQPTHEAVMQACRAAPTCIVCAISSTPGGPPPEVEPARSSQLLL